MSNVVIAGTASGATALPVANSIDASNDYLPIYTASATATQAINRATLLGITGSPVGTSDSQALTNKTIGNTNTITVKDGSLTLQNTADATKQVAFGLSGITAGNTRTITVPDASLTLVGTATTQTLTNKTLTSPAITGGTLDNATVTVDTVAGHTVSNTGTIYGISVTTGQISSALTLTSSLTLNTTLSVTGASTLTGAVSTAGQISTQTGTAPPAAGASTAGIKMSSTANLGLFYGSGAPTFSAAQGALYMRTDGSSTSTRLYINTTGSTTWTNVTTAA